MSEVDPFVLGSEQPEMTDAEMPWREGQNGDVIINWDYDNGEGETLRDMKRRWEEELEEEHGAPWMAESRARLEKEFEMMVTQGMLT